MSRLNPDVKQKWLAALRSGKYTQTMGALCRLTDQPGYAVAGHCCLGVLAAELGWLEPHDEYPDTPRLYVRTASDRLAGGFLPDDRAAELGFGCGDQSVLAQMNDDGKTFAQIADSIEENL